MVRVIKGKNIQRKTWRETTITLSSGKVRVSECKIAVNLWRKSKGIIDFGLRSEGASYRESTVLLCALIFWPCLSPLLTINGWNARMVFIDVLLLAEVAPCEAVLLPKRLSKWSLMTTKYNNYHSLGKRMCREQECRYERSDLCPSCAWSLALAC